MALTAKAVKLAKLLPEHFIPHCKIQQGEGGPPIPFNLWDFQVDALHEIERQSRIIFLKARQLGLSWLTLAYMLWLVSCNEGQTCLILNRGLRESIELLDRVRFMHKRLPLELRPILVKDVVDHLEFANGSRIYSLPATEFAGTGITAQLVMIDEWAKIRGISKILTSLLPTLSAGGKLIGISTANGFHNAFAAEWRKAISGLSRFFPLFIPWDAHPERDEAWYEEKREEMPTERELHQEYPSEWLDAFQLPGESVFRDEFDRARHVVDIERDPKANWPQVRGIDFGYHHGIHLWAQVEAKRHVYVYAELHAERMTTQAMMEQVVVRDLELGVKTEEAPAGCDPAGKAQTSVATESDHFTVERFGVHVNAAEVAPRDRVTLIKQLLKEDRLHIHVGCDFLTEALEQAQWAKGAPPMGSTADPILKETYEKDGYYEHPLDTLGYLLVNVFPVRGKPAGAKTERKPAKRPRKGSRYSNSEFG
jgi:hypothetical protein